MIQDASIGPSVSADSLASETPWSNCRVQWSPLRATTDRIALTLPTHLTRLTPHSLQLQALKHQHRTAPQGVRQLLRPTASHEVLRELHQTDEACTDACWASCVWRSLQLAGVVGGRIGGLRKNQWMCIYIINYNCTKCGECILFIPSFPAEEADWHPLPLLKLGRRNHHYR